MRARHTLDHVAAATPSPRRALLLDARFRPPGAHLLCVGDHDLGDFAPGLLVGEWPKALGLPRVRLPTWPAKPYAAAVERGAVAVPDGLERALRRILVGGYHADGGPVRRGGRVRWP